MKESGDGVRVTKSPLQEAVAQIAGTNREGELRKKVYAKLGLPEDTPYEQVFPREPVRSIINNTPFKRIHVLALATFILDRSASGNPANKSEVASYINPGFTIYQVENFLRFLPQRIRNLIAINEKMRRSAENRKSDGPKRHSAPTKRWQENMNTIKKKDE